MRIAVIGTGNVGRALARAGNVAGHTVVVTSKNPAHAEKVAEELKVAVAGSSREAAQDADMVILAVPSTAVASVLDDIRQNVAGTIIVDPTNPSADHPELLQSGSMAETVAVLAPDAKVVKAFNTIFASRLNDPVIDGEPLDGFYAGDDEVAKQDVASLLAEMGYRPIDVGELMTARVLEAMAVLNFTLNARNGWPWQSGWKLLGSTS
jgi:NADPH-dependent F420 reductase